MLNSLKPLGPSYPKASQGLKAKTQQFGSKTETFAQNLSVSPPPPSAPLTEYLKQKRVAQNGSLKTFAHSALKQKLTRKTYWDPPPLTP